MFEYTLIHFQCSNYLLIGWFKVLHQFHPFYSLVRKHQFVLGPKCTTQHFVVTDSLPYILQNVTNYQIHDYILLSTKSTSFNSLINMNVLLFTRSKQFYLVIYMTVYFNLENYPCHDNQKKTMPLKNLGVLLCFTCICGYKDPFNWISLLQGTYDHFYKSLSKYLLQKYQPLRAILKW